MSFRGLNIFKTSLIIGLMAILLESFDARIIVRSPKKLKGKWTSKH